MTRQHAVVGSDLEEAIRRVATYRAVEFASLAEVLDGLAELAQTRWLAWRAKQDPTDRLPVTFAHVTDAVVACGGPAVSGAIASTTWNLDKAERESA